MIGLQVCVLVFICFGTDFMPSQIRSHRTSLLGNSPASAFTLCSTWSKLSTYKTKEKSRLKESSASTYVSPSGLVQQLVLHLVSSRVTSEHAPTICQTMALSVPLGKYDPKGQDSTCPKAYLMHRVTRRQLNLKN